MSSPREEYQQELLCVGETNDGLLNVGTLEKPTVENEQQSELVTRKKD